MLRLSSKNYVEGSPMQKPKEEVMYHACIRLIPEYPGDPARFARRSPPLLIEGLGPYAHRSSAYRAAARWLSRRDVNELPHGYGAVKPAASAYPSYPEEWGLSRLA